MKRIFYFLALLTCNSIAFATAPAGYYDAADNTNTNTLRLALRDIISSGYTSISYGDLWNAYATTDVNPSTGMIWDMYSGCSFTLYSDQCGTYSSECDCYNREHTTPKSWFGDASPMYSDLFNVYPTDGKVNGMRSNYPYGEVGSASYVSGNGSKVGSSDFSGYSGTVFEPMDEYKGDLARTVMYMATRYASNLSSWVSGYSGSTDVEVVFNGTSGLTAYAINLLLSWSRMDPVSAKETARNDAVYAIQKNRNPFVDYPGLEEYIWGNKTSELFSVSGIPSPGGEDQPVITTGRVVDNGTTLSFGIVGDSSQKALRVKTQDITGDLTVQVTGDGFSVPVSVISAANAEAGYDLTVTFAPGVAGDYTGVLTISGGGLPVDFVVTLSGSK